MHKTQTKCPPITQTIQPSQHDYTKQEAQNHQMLGLRARTQFTWLRHNQRRKKTKYFPSKKEASINNRSTPTNRANNAKTNTDTAAASNTAVHAAKSTTTVATVTNMSRRPNLSYAAATKHRASVATETYQVTMEKHTNASTTNEPYSLIGDWMIYDCTIHMTPYIEDFISDCHPTKLW
jgi:hypothetical protein